MPPPSPSREGGKRLAPTARRSKGKAINRLAGRNKWLLTGPLKPFIARSDKLVAATKAGQSLLRADLDERTASRARRLDRSLSSNASAEKRKKKEKEQKAKMQRQHSLLGTKLMKGRRQMKSIIKKKVMTTLVTDAATGAVTRMSAAGATSALMGTMFDLVASVSGGGGSKQSKAGAADFLRAVVTPRKMPTKSIKQHSFFTQKSAADKGNAALMRISKSQHMTLRSQARLLGIKVPDPPKKQKKKKKKRVRAENLL